MHSIQEFNTTWQVRAIANSTPVVNVWDEEKMIGFARATSDTIYHNLYNSYQLAKTEKCDAKLLSRREDGSS